MPHDLLALDRSTPTPIMDSDLAPLHLDLRQSSEHLVNLLPDTGKLVWCQDTVDLWFVRNQKVLDRTFIYQDDLTINTFRKHSSAMQFIQLCQQHYIPGRLPTKACYLMEDKVTEKYICYHDPNYVVTKYGIPIPRQAVIRRYSDRFKRDKAILELEQKYTIAPRSSVGKIDFLSLPTSTAIIVSDGSLRQDKLTYSYVYVDKDTTTQQTGTFTTSTPKHSTILAEILGVHRGLDLALKKTMKNIYIYYDNKAIQYCLTNKKFDNVLEVKRYRALVQHALEIGCTLHFNEIHPKSTKGVTTYNQALTYLHTMCDKACTDLATLTTTHGVINNIELPESSDFSIGGTYGSLWDRPRNNQQPNSPT